MTLGPEDLATIRDYANKGYMYLTRRFTLALCDALEESWAERDQHQRGWGTANLQLREMRERAERWETEARQFCQNVDYWRERAERAEAALARVRALCDADHGWDARHVAEIRAAIEEDQ